ncbi:T9SS type B sorting domain-containing protein [Chitinophaga tropicalis]|uniref:DUF11 domain-containing protein n=1 Tax=Chitinophaga tropicalis TaxID=2683588 RepID=A0A7K1U1Y8_9BACT|nr:gliding motility-associated C-terminal domain-containing protein [Chitinophaga tropicalis]MVT08348.1 DUF11 domain-containing protein [Chitinophaga tropicalis]
MSFRRYMQFRQKALAFPCLFLLIIVFQGYQVRAQTASYVWKNAPIGGGGFVTGIVTHKTSGDRYCRTDVGGAYRWDAANNKWIELLDWLDESENGFYGVEALALDPQNPNNVYMLCGTSYINSGRTAILKSTDKGNTFTYTDVTAKFKAHGNGPGRGNGERLVVDPNNSNILFCGTRANGLWKSTDAGLTWNLAWNGVTTTPNENGICFVVYDPSGSVVGGATQTMYIGVSRTGGANIYKSTDGGTTFTDISATTGFMPRRAALQGTTMYVTYSDDAGPQSSGGDGKLYKLNTATGLWTNVTPVHSKDYSYGGVSIDPTNVNRVVVSSCGLYWNNQFGTGWGDFVFLSTDGGSTWTLKNGRNATYDSNGMGWSDGGAVNWMDCIEFDQSNLSKVRVVGGGGIYTCSDITAVNPTWKYDVIGIEETALLDGISIPGGPVISSFGDVTGFVHEPLTSYPANKLAPSDQNNQSIAYAAGNTSKVVRAANTGSVVYYSTDKGASWMGCATNKGTDGRVAISADGGTILHCPGGSATTYYTTNNGGAWSDCSGVSLRDASPVADQVNPNYFYIYNPTNGQMLRSSNKGVSFSVAGTPGASTANYPWEAALIRTVPGFEGHVWVPLGRNGLKYSTNYGAAYTTVSNVTYCKTVGIGKAMSGSSYPVIFIWGTVSGVTGLFRSTDQGATWTRINDDAHKFAGAPLLIGDMNVAGRVYMSAGGGRGLIYWEENNKRSANWKSAAYTGTGKNGTVKSGDEITYTIHIRNTGNVALNNVNVIDTVPAFTVFVSADGGITPDGNGKLTWTITNIPVGSADITRSFIVKVASDLTNAGYITNTADVDNGDGTGQHPTTPPDPSNPNNPKTNPDPDEPSTKIPVDNGKLSLNWKSAQYTPSGTKGGVTTGDLITYTIHIRNTGSIKLENVRIVDTIPAYTEFVSADEGITPDGNKKLYWTIAEIPVGSADITRSFIVKVASDLTGATNIINTAGVDNGNGKGNQPTSPPMTNDPGNPDTNPTSGPSTNIPVDKLNNWECWKTVVTASGNDQVKPDEALTYTIHIRNTGNVAVDHLVVTDPIPEHTSFVSAGNNGTYDPASNIVTWNVGEIATGATTTITMIVKAADNLDSIPVIVNTASATDGTSTKPTSGCDPASPDCTGDTGTTIVTIPGDAALVFANAMSPNGDGKNEYFIIKGLEKYPPASLFVFNRWGNMVYQSAAYNNNWDGAGLSEGTYYYKLVIEGVDSKKTYTGWILLKRK